ncbi:mechanosensitive ion channel protein 10-like [Olea europaea var. sylvestris]|uniref:mechanosensitive ion channel protein 10-like n=1 Tax=Olea europaea var. sylvestris TaxID=158386 RepID=UPI000C1D7B19|nr:mechanosensitive ion channel protein 10-like [Olea europaea var. sylvestris]
METQTSDHVIVFMDEQKHSNGHSLESKPVAAPYTVAETKPPLPPARVQSLHRLSFSKPKSRLLEFTLPANQKIIAESHEFEPLKRNESFPSDSDEESEEDDEEFDEGEGGTVKEKLLKKKFKINCRILIEWILFCIISTCLICSLTISSLRNQLKCGLELWRWCLMILVIFSGRLVSEWIIRISAFLIERNFMLREKVLYFVYGLRKSIQNCVWLGLVLLAWTVIFSYKIHKENKLLQKVFQALVAVLIGATIWLIKIVLVKSLASSFHVTTYFDRMKESVFHNYVLDILLGPPMDEVTYEAEHHKDLMVSKSLPAKLRPESRAFSKSKRVGTRRIDIEKLRKLSTQSTASAWSAKRLANYVMSFGLSTISKTVDEFGRAEAENITSELEARNCAKRIFKNVAKPGAKYIEEEDLMRFLKRVEIHTIFPLFEGALETGKITKSAFRNWVVRAYHERKSLAHSLNDTKTAVQQLHKLASAVVSMIIAVVFVLVMGLASTKVVAFIITQLLLVGFTFQNMCKTVFESIVFVFVMHPFDIGDRCVIDGVQLIVEEMNILTTVFLRYDNEKIYYPNAILITKPISNFYRSPEMCDTIDFTIDVSTSMETIIALKKAIQMYIESKPKYWNPKHSVIVKEIENVDKMKMAVSVQHTINHQNYSDRNARITELLLELKKIFESLNIKYHLLPQVVHLTQFNTNNSRMPLHS